MLGFREGDILRDPFRKVASHSLHPLPFINGGGDSIFKNLEKGSGLKKVSENRGRDGGGGGG